MNAQMFLVTLTLAILLIISCTAGCMSVRTSDTHNVTAAVQSYNTWTSGQKELDSDMRGTITTIGNHITTYNAEIIKDKPDYALLRQNLVQDRQLLDTMGSRIDTLSLATEQFEHETDLTYNNATVKQTKGHLAIMSQYMKIYAVDLGNARQYLIEYVNNAESYIGPEDPEYWNEQYRRDAMTAKDMAVRAFADGDSALNDLTREAKELEQVQ